MNQIPFHKIHASGNDFVLLETLPPQLKIADLCDRRYGVGADGVLVVHQDGGELSLDHYDPDGGRTFCLNGSMAALHVLAAEGRIPLEGVIRSEGMTLPYRLGENVGVALPLRPVRALTWRGDGEQVDGFFVDAGNPQFVIHNQLDDPRFEALAPVIRNDFATFPQGVNVMFTRDTPNGVRIRAYERGVEGMTHSCGSGMYAAALVLLGQDRERVAFIPDGRGRITVTKRDDHLLMSATAARIFSGVYSWS